MSSSLDPSCDHKTSTSTHSTRDELTLTCAELNQLREKEQALLDQLRPIRTATPARRDQVHASCPIPADLISYLPVEVLLRIIELALQNPLPVCDPHRHVKRELASVSRHWRNVILGSPGLWNYIKISQSWSVPFVEAHVARSAECPLDIKVKGWEFPGELGWNALHDRLGVVLRCQHRWRSLFLQSADANPILQLISSSGPISFKRLTIVGNNISYLFWFWTSEDWSPVNYLKLDTNVPLHHLSKLSNLETLVVHFGLDEFSPSPAEFSLPKLKTLRISGNTGDLELLPDTLHFPLLDSLSVNVSSARGLMDAIVAPNLRYVCFDPYGCLQNMSSVFGNLSSKFSSVGHLCLRSSSKFWQPKRGTDVESAEAVSKAFPSVRHVEFYTKYIKAFFSSEATCPADRWEHLQTLEISGDFGDEISGLKEWLRRRSLEDKPILDVIISSTFSEVNTPKQTSSYESLRPYCNVVVPSGLDLASGLPRSVSTHLHVTCTFII
ncbi:hypothetical protein M404DRAFT_179589 [Pisolithus tinctorius Marx 270]|uniref:Uncharacterized protein n=1 Tax=Pisolithus tinctorius Marx 270 TaxID=870435 RepID=A0A0C3PZ53_PISTI|nr:hypothetical protein M404DRAFT_179589 [Pisolithus tinctorius Marx 270]